MRRVARAIVATSETSTSVVPRRADAPGTARVVGPVYIAGLPGHIGNSKAALRTAGRGRFPTHRTSALARARALT